MVDIVTFPQGSMLLLIIIESEMTNGKIVSKKCASKGHYEFAAADSAVFNNWSVVVVVILIIFWWKLYLFVTWILISRLEEYPVHIICYGIKRRKRIS